MGRRMWLGLGLGFFVAAALVVAVSLGGGTSHPAGDIDVSSATPPGATMRIDDSSRCNDEFPGWLAIGTPADGFDVAEWFDVEWGPVVEPWTTRSNSLGATGEWRHYKDVSLLLRVDGKFLVQTFVTSDHSCPLDGDTPWGGTPESAWSNQDSTCEDTTIVVFGGIRYDPKRDSFGSAFEPVTDPPRGWDVIAYPNGASVSYIGADVTEISVRLPGASDNIRYALSVCPPSGDGT